MKLSKISELAIELGGQLSVSINIHPPEASAEIYHALTAAGAVWRPVRQVETTIWTTARVDDSEDVTLFLTPELMAELGLEAPCATK